MAYRPLGKGAKDEDESGETQKKYPRGKHPNTVAALHRLNLFRKRKTEVEEDSEPDKEEIEDSAEENENSEEDLRRTVESSTLYEKLGKTVFNSDEFDDIEVTLTIGEIKDMIDNRA